MNYYITFDNANKTEKIIDFSFANESNNNIDFNIGTLLVDFIYTDLDMYSKGLKKLIDKFRNEEHSHENIEFAKDLQYLFFTTLSKSKDPFLCDGYDYKHIYLESLRSDYFIEHVLWSYNIENLLESKLNFTKIQDFYKKAINFCLNNDFDEKLGKLTIPQRFLIFQNLYDPDCVFPVQGDVHQSIVPSLFITTPFKLGNEGDPFFDTEKDEYKELNNALINMVREVNVTCKEYNIFGDVSEICYLEFMKMVSLNINVKKCKNCGKLFVATDNYNTEYCSRIPIDETKSCREIGAFRKYAKKVKNDPILSEYNKAYKTHFARIRYKTMTKAAFSTWALQATEMKNKAKVGEISFDEYVKWLKK